MDSEGGLKQFLALSKTSILMGHCNLSLSLNTTIMVWKNCPIIGEKVFIIFTQSMLQYQYYDLLKKPFKVWYYFKKRHSEFFYVACTANYFTFAQGLSVLFFFLSWQPWLVLGCGFGPLNSHCEWEMLWCCSKDYGKCDTNVFWLSRETYTGSKVMPVMFKGFQITITPPMKAK